MQKQIYPIRIGPERLDYRGIVFDYSDIETLILKNHFIKEYVGAIQSREYRKLSLTIIHWQGRRITLKPPVFPLFMPKIDKMKQLLEIHEQVARNSVEHRFGRYMQKLRSEDRFQYDGYEFRADGTLGRGRKSIDLRDEAVTVKLRPYEMEVLAGNGTGKPASFRLNLESDADCIIRLVEEHFGKKMAVYPFNPPA